MTVTLQSIDELPRLFSELEQDFNRLDYAPALGEIADDLRDVHQNYFLGEFGPSGRDWQPWRWRSPDAPADHPTLNVSGRLRDSLVTENGDHVEEVDSRELTWGTAVPYAGIHNFGGVTTAPATGLVGRFGGYLPPGKQINIPQREFVGITPEITTNYVETVADWAVDELKE